MMSGLQMDLGRLHVTCIPVTDEWNQKMRLLGLDVTALPMIRIGAPRPKVVGPGRRRIDVYVEEVGLPNTSGELDHNAITI